MDWLGIVSLGANVVMAGAAVFGVGMWRSQLRGGLEHDVARRAVLLALAVEQLVWSTTLTAGNLYEWSCNGGHPDELVPKLEAQAQRLERKLEELDDLITEVRAYWTEGHALDLLELYNTANTWAFDFSRGGPKLLRLTAEERANVDTDKEWVRVFMRDPKFLGALEKHVRLYAERIQEMFDPIAGTDRKRALKSFEKSLARRAPRDLEMEARLKAVRETLAAPRDTGPV